jgi:hypothetical protein
LALEHGATVDIQGFHKLREEHTKAAKGTWTGSGDRLVPAELVKWQGAGPVPEFIGKNIYILGDFFKKMCRKLFFRFCLFFKIWKNNSALGYDNQLESLTRVLYCWYSPQDTFKDELYAWVSPERCPFYAEAGGNSLFFFPCPVFFPVFSFMYCRSVPF